MFWAPAGPNSELALAIKVCSRDSRLFWKPCARSGFGWLRRYTAQPPSSATRPSTIGLPSNDQNHDVCLACGRTVAGAFAGAVAGAEASATGAGATVAASIGAAGAIGADAGAPVDGAGVLAAICAAAAAAANLASSSFFNASWRCISVRFFSSSATRDSMALSAGSSAAGSTPAGDAA